MGSFSRIYWCGFIFGLLDLLQGITVLAFYSFQQWQHRHCTYAHGVQECEYFHFRSNHSVRVIIGIIEGLLCIFVASSLFICYKKEKTMLVWGWIAKPLIGLVLNLYFVTVWLIERGRYYHSYETEDQVWQETVFIYFGGISAILYVLLAFLFCCTSAGFVFRVRKERQRHSTASLSTETKV